jgi:predicted alpha/beta-hydrolase family hydrolase
MKATSSQVVISESIGPVSTLTLSPTTAIAAIALAHGAGAGMTHPFMETLAQKLFERSIATVRYNFPYMEKKKKMPDVPAVAEKAVGSVLKHAVEKYAELPVFLAGKSFGGRMSSQFASKGDVKASGIIFYGFPLHAPGKPGNERAAHLKNVKVPMLFLQGTNDTLATLPLIEDVCQALPMATLATFAGADHSFKIKGKEIIDQLVVATVQWIEIIRSSSRVK